MRKTFLIIAAVAVYCLFEVMLLLSIATPNWDYPTSNIRQIVAGFAQLVLIPGLAAIFSRLIYGRHDWKKRVLIILVLGSVVPLLFALLVVVGLVLEPVALISDTAAYV